MAPLDGSARNIRRAVGIGLRAPHIREVLSTRPPVGWFEIHAENYFGAGPAVTQLEQIRRDYPLSLHGVGLSLGSAEGLSQRHLQQLRALVHRVDPFLVSEHLSWSVVGGVYLNDLLPLPYTEEALEIVADNVDRAQDALGRRILIENPSRYLGYRHSTLSEPEFLSALVRRTGCGILCDVNNIYVSATNFRFDPIAYLDALPAQAIGEIHLAGHHAAEDLDVLIDDHGSRIAQPVWELYAQALRRFVTVPTLIEWDTNIPALEILLEEARHAQELADVDRNAEFA